MEKQTKAPAELKQLDFLVGKWHSEGNVEQPVKGEPTEIKGTDVYEWVAGGYFLLHHVDVMMGESRVEVVELIGYDELTKTFPMHSYDNQGEQTEMQASFDNQRVMKIKGKQMRSTLIVNEEGDKMTANWERSDDGEVWMPWMGMKFRKD